jgi:hypothetical protein
MIKKLDTPKNIALFKKEKLSFATQELDASLRNLESTFYVYIMWGGSKLKKKNQEIITSLKKIINHLSGMG